MTSKTLSVILRAQLKVRELNSKRALDEFGEIEDITQLDWLVARGDRHVLRNVGMYDETTEDSDYNDKLSTQIANDVYECAIEQNNLPCLTREERRNEREGN